MRQPMVILDARRDDAGGPLNGIQEAVISFPSEKLATVPPEKAKKRASARLSASIAATETKAAARVRR